MLTERAQSKPISRRTVQKAQTREALLETLLDEHVGRALARGLKTLPPQASLVDALVHQSLALFDSYGKDPELSQAALQGSLFEARPRGPSALRLAAFRGWVLERLALASARGELGPIDPTLAFVSYFSLYFGLLVAGLRGDFTRAQQKKLLTASLQRLFALEPSP